MATTVLSDNFNRANSSTVGSPSVGPNPTIEDNFSGSGGSWGINGNALAPGASLTENMIWWDVGSDTYTLQATITALASGGTNVNSIMWRGDGVGQFWMAQANNGGTWETYYRDTGFNALNSGGPTVAAGQVIKVDVTPTNVDFYVNGSLIFSNTDTHLASNTKVGFRAYETNVRWDDLTVVVPDPPAQPYKYLLPQRAVSNRAAIRRALA